MKEKLKKRPVLENWFYTGSPLIITRPALKESLSCIGYLLGGFLLSCGRLGSHPAPFSLGLLTSAGGGIRGLSVLIGAVLGFLLMQPFSLGLEFTSIALLTFVTMYIFSALWVAKQQWFHCLIPGTMAAIVGGIFLLGQDITPLLLSGYCQSVFLSALSPLAFDALLEGKRRSLGALLAVCFFLLGAAALPAPWGISPGLILAVGLTAVGIRRGDLGIAVILGAGAGLSLDAGLMTGGLYTLCLTAGALAGCSLSQRQTPLRILLFLVGFSAAVLYTGIPSLPMFLGLGIGTGLSLFVPSSVIGSQEDNTIAQASFLVEERLGTGAAALERLYEAIGIDPEEQADQERRNIFDRATTTVCRSCSRCDFCWKKNSTATYQTLRDAMDPIIHRGKALQTDFPEDFSAGCRHMEELLSALDRELHQAACRSQSRSLAEEPRFIASRCFLHLSELLSRNARALRFGQHLPREVYGVKLGVSAAGRRGNRISGDRGVSFHTEDGRFYVLLCDGMGTGQEAAKESLLAVDTLASLIQAGLRPDHAMELLGGMYLLRDSGSFSTIDILELSLVSAQGTLYKWGAAPSFLKSGDLVKKLGTAAPPPGLGVGSTSGAEVIRLSLWGGDMLILASDGLGEDEAETLIRNFQGDKVKDLSAQLIARAAELGGEDDMTAAVVRLDELRP